MYESLQVSNYVENKKFRGVKREKGKIMQSMPFRFEKCIITPFILAIERLLCLFRVITPFRKVVIGILNFVLSMQFDANVGLSNIK